MRPYEWSRHRSVRWASFIALLLCFGLCRKQPSLYHSNQNTYFLHGIAAAEQGQLQEDRMARTRDPFPVFSAGVQATHRYLDQSAFHLYHILLLSLFAYALLGICAQVFRWDILGTRSLMLLTILALVYSGQASAFVEQVPALKWLADLVDPEGIRFDDMTGALFKGVAGQHIAGAYLQPSEFGILLLLSMLLYLRNRHWLAVLCLAATAIIHGSYAIWAGMLLCLYTRFEGLRRGSFRGPLLISGAGALLMAPFVLTSLIHFQSTNATLGAQAREILVHERIAHHADVSQWLNWSVAIQSAVILTALFFTRRTRLFPVLIMLLVTSLVLTLVQAASGSTFLALLFPWRISTVLVPLSSTLLLAAVSGAVSDRVNARVQRWRPMVRTGMISLALFCGYLGSISHWRTMARDDKPRTLIATYVRTHPGSGDLYLIPSEQGGFRITARASVLVDNKNHPYKDTEVLQWHDRLARCNAFYSASGEEACSILTGLIHDYGITHVVMPSSSSVCPGMEHVLSEPRYALYALSKADHILP